jgi:hypothetical protein
MMARMATARRNGRGPTPKRSRSRTNGETVVAKSDVEVLVELREMLAAAGAPDELLRVIEGPGTPEEVMRRIAESGLLPSPEDSLAGLIEFWQPLQDSTDPLEAELAGSQFLGMVRDGGASEADLPLLLQELVAQAEGYGGPAALAMLRALAVVAPTPVRESAAAAADRLVETGLTDPVWGADIGQPKPGRCFGYSDVFGTQETVAITFRYRRKQHALCVLVDHQLGGGVKDCWATDQVDQVLAGYRAQADPELEFHEYEPAEAAAILAAALGKQPCPEQADQVEDVRDNLALLRQRVALLAGAGGSGSRPGTTTVHRLKVGLHGARPPIWRRLEVPSSYTLDKLHQTIQRAFGWQDYHLWVFETPGGEYGTPDPELEHRDAVSSRLRQVAPQPGDRIRYTYDFGDGWRHDIAVEEVFAAEPGVAYPRCVAGRRAGPPEDCGGIWGYHELLEILADPDHPEHRQRLEWLGLSTADDLDPAAFDQAEVNRSLPAKVLVKG